MLDQLKRLLGITDNTQDALLSELLLESQDYIEDYLQRSLNLDTYEEYIQMDSAGFTKFVLRNFPIESVESVEKMDGEIIPPEAYRLLKQTGELRFLSHYPYGDYVIQYTGGFDPLPAWAKKAIVETAAILYSESGSGSSGVAIGSIKSEEIVGVAKVTYETGSSSSSSSSGGGSYGAIPASMIEILDQHRNRYA